jgi:VWFA-related protein
MHRCWIYAACAAATLLPCALFSPGQTTGPPQYRTEVDLVTVTFRVADSKGRTISGLMPDEVHIFEDDAPQKTAFFSEGTRPGGANIFILFDTSNRMYNAFPYVHDSISDFLRHLDPADSVAIYTFSRNLFRASPLTTDRALARAGLYNAIAGDDTALFNSILLTIRDAAHVPSRKFIVVFSNGPDNASMVSPYDVGGLAEDQGIPIYLISSCDLTQDRIQGAAIESLAARTGGKVYYAPDWRRQAGAFAAVRDDISGSYTASYYPTPSANTGFRKIRVEIEGPRARGSRVWARAGYDAAQKIASSREEQRQK